MTKLTGFPDYDAARLKILQEVTARLDGSFASYGYTRVEPPMVDHADALLERSGEETRRRAYLFDDPRGAELCLRSDLTLPVCRLALRQGLLKESGLVRLSYAGPVFRYEQPGSGKLHQFHQAGIELIGTGDPLVAEAETVSLAVDAARAGGIEDTLMLLGDVRFFRVLLDHYPLPERLKLELKRDFLRLDHAPVRTRRAQAPSADQLTLMQSVASIGKNEAVKLIESFLSVAEINRIGTRGIDEIVERMIDNAEDQVAQLPEDIAAQMRAFLEIEDDPRDALEDIATFGQEVGVAFGPLIDAFHRRLDLMEAHGVDLDATCLCTGLKRDIDYYSGFIFEIAHDGEAGIWPLGGGGRYDTLISSLDPSKDCPAIGFALGVERVVMARQRGFLDGAVALAPSLHAHVIAKTPQNAASAAEAAQILRRVGWRVSGGGVADGTVPKVPFLILVETDDQGAERALVRSQADNKQYAVRLTDLGAFAEKVR